MRHLAVLAVVYALVAALVIPSSLFAAGETTPAEQQAAPAVTTPEATETAPAPTPAAPPPAPAAPAAAATPAAPAAPAAPAPDPEPLQAQKLAEERPEAAPKAKAAASAGVTIKDFDFTPASITVSVGDTVTWTNQGPTGHSATASGGAFDTGILDAGQSGSHTFDTAGTFAYVCTPHPFMKGTVIVQGASTGGTQDDSGGSGGSQDSSGSTDSGASDGPSLASTGMDALALGVLGALMLALGIAVRRRSAEESPQPAGRIGW